MCLIIPEQYKSSLGVIQTQQAIKDLKDYFEQRLSEELKLTRVSSPLFVLPETGTNDNLNGVEKAVNFNVPNIKQRIIGMDVCYIKEKLTEYATKPRF